MKIYDCFMYNNEKIILDLRLSYLNQYIEKFIIVESKYDHQGNLKKIFLKLKISLNIKKKLFICILSSFQSTYLIGIEKNIKEIIFLMH